MGPQIVCMVNHFEMCNKLQDLEVLYSNNFSNKYDMVVELYGPQQEDKSLTMYFDEMTYIR